MLGFINCQQEMHFVGVLLVVLAGVHRVYPLITVSSNIVTDLAGEVCPQTIQFTCVAVNVEPTLVWGFDALTSDSTTFHYVLDTSHRFPRTILEDDNVTFVIVSAVQDQQSLDMANFTSTLTVSLSTLIYFKVQRIICGTFLNNNNFELSLDGVTVIAAPPPPVFTCSLADDGRSVTFNWSSSYNSNYSVNNYCLQPNTLTCSACNISPNTLYVCSGLQVGEVYMINLMAFNCDMQQGATSNVFIDLEGEPEPPGNLEVVSLFNSSVLTQVLVKWRVNGSEDRSNKCEHKTTTYSVILQNDVNPPIEREVNLDSCEDSICSTDITIFDPNGFYSVSVSTNSILGTRSVMFHSMIPANATSLLRASFNFSNCITYVTCSSDVFEAGNCGISYSLGSDTGSVIGMLNVRHALPVLTASSEYKFVTNLTLNSSFTIEVHQSFPTGDFDPKLTNSNIGMVVVGILLLVTAVGVFFASILLLGGCITHLRVICCSHGNEDGVSISKLSRGREKYLSWAVCGLSLSAIILTLVLWVSFGGIVGQQENTCEASWQMSRDDLAATSLFFSIISLLISLGSLIFVLRKWDKKLLKVFKNLPVRRTGTALEHEALSNKDSNSDDKQPQSTDEQAVSETPMNQGQVEESTKPDIDQTSAIISSAAGKANSEQGEDVEHKTIAPLSGGIQEEYPFSTKVGDELVELWTGLKDRVTGAGNQPVKKEDEANSVAGSQPVDPVKEDDIKAKSTNLVPNEVQVLKEDDKTEEHQPVAHWQDGILQEETVWRRMSGAVGEQLKRVKDHLSIGPETEKRVQENNCANTDNCREEDSNRETTGSKSEPGKNDTDKEEQKTTDQGSYDSEVQASKLAGQASGASNVDKASKSKTATGAPTIEECD